MSAQPATVTHYRMTPEEYLALPEEKPYFEYIAGEAVQKAMVNRPHAALAGRMSARLDAYFERHGGLAGPEPRVRFETRDGVEYRLPDVAYWRPEKPIGPDDLMLPPTLAVEIPSPGQTLASQRDKCRFMRAHGVDVCWLVLPETRSVEVFEGDGETTLSDDAVLTSDHLPGFALPLLDLFAVLD